MGLEDLLKPGEDVEFSSSGEVKYADKDYNVYLTADRFILHKERGILPIGFLQSDDIVSWKLKNIERADFQEKGTISTKGIVTIEMKNRKIQVEASSAQEGQNLYQNLMQFI